LRKQMRQVGRPPRQSQLIDKEAIAGGRELSGRSSITSESDLKSAGRCRRG